MFADAEEKKRVILVPERHWNCQIQRRRLRVEKMEVGVGRMRMYYWNLYRLLFGCRGSS